MDIASAKSSLRNVYLDRIIRYTTLLGVFALGAFIEIGYLFYIKSRDAMVVAFFIRNMNLASSIRSAATIMGDKDEPSMLATIKNLWGPNSKH